MTDDEKLTSPSFEKLPAGFVVGTDTYKLPSNEVAADLDYETKILEPADDTRSGLLIGVELSESRLLAGELEWQAKLGAVARSDLRVAERLRAGPIEKIRVSDPALTVASTTTMIEAAPLKGTAVHSTAAAHQVMVSLDDQEVQLVEAYEVV